jgi:hypothetical protein
MANVKLIRKSELAEKYGVHPSYLARLMNGLYFEELEREGYTKKSITLPPKVLRKFIELHGEPLQDTEI